MQEPDKNHPSYLAGWHAGMNGANMENCHFGLFGTPADEALWMLGRKEATEKKHAENNTRS